RIRRSTDVEDHGLTFAEQGAWVGLLRYVQLYHALARRMRITLVLTVVALIACGADNATGPANCETTTAVSATVSAGTMPTLSWTPTCSVNFVLVENEAGHDQWWVTDASGVCRVSSSSW